jgi:hypothetical protein
MQYTNPRKFAQFNDWPSGNKRVRCTFAVESGGKKGQRVRRVTDKPGCPGVECAPKLTTFAKKVLLVDGDDGRIYIMEYTEYGTVSVMSSDMKHHHEGIYDSDVRKFDLLAMFKAFDEYRIEQDEEWIHLIDLAVNAQEREHNSGTSMIDGAIARIDAVELYAKERGYSIQWPGLYPLVEKVV